eukprot:3996066-Prymnesium_polylepis.1
MLRGEHPGCSPSDPRAVHTPPSTRTRSQTRAACPIHTHLPRARSMTVSLCVLALHGWVAKYGNYSEKIGGECGGSGCG